MPQEPTRGATELSTRSWQAHKGLARLVRALAFLMPLALSVVTVRLVGDYLYRPPGWTGLVLWIAQAAAVGSLVSIVVDRGTRRFLPLAALLDLSLVFPDQSPSRFGVALRTGSVRKLSERLEEIRHDGLGATTDEAATTALELVALLNGHDRVTRGHAERVRAHADLIAQEMGVSEPDRLRLAWGVLLHDIGKLTVPAEVLNKKGKLSGEEWDLLKKHPEAAVDILAPLRDWLGDWLLAASEHHERWDGEGYPLGLVGTEVSVAGRITAVADAYDVITSRRSYKESMSGGAGRQELVRCSGTQFDPQVVRSFLGVSLGRRWSLGPLAWLGDLPLGQIGTTVVRTPAVALAGAVIGVGATAAAPPPETTPDLLAYSTTTTETILKPGSTTVIVTSPARTSVPLSENRRVVPSGSSPQTAVSPSETSSPDRATTSTTAPTTSTRRTTRPARPTTTSTRRTSTTESATTAPTTTTTSTSTTTAPTTTSIPGGIAFGGHIYLLGTPGLTWQEAVAEAETAGGHLLSITSSGENSFVLDHFGGDRAVWLALSDVASEGTFVWATGEPLTYSNWMAGEPSNWGGVQDYGAMVTDIGEWDDVGDSDPWPYSDGEWHSDAPPVATVIEFDG